MLILVRDLSTIKIGGTHKIRIVNLDVDNKFLKDHMPMYFNFLVQSTVSVKSSLLRHQCSVLISIDSLQFYDDV